MNVSMMELGDSMKLPFLRVSDYLKVLALHEKLPLLWGCQGTATETLAKFWRRYRQHEGSHAIYQDHIGRLCNVLPLQLHGDEGQTLKKSACLIFNFQSPMGRGTSKQAEQFDFNLNYVGSTYSTRFLLAICAKKVYKKHPARIDAILDAIVGDLRDLYYNGISLVIDGKPVRMYVAVIGFKGDWPIHAKIGHLARHFARKGVYKMTENSGICHLCRAGEVNYDPHDFSPNAAWRDSILTKVPWDNPGPLCNLPQTPNKELMHKFDAFHTLHKGCFAELGGSGLDSWVGKLLYVEWNKDMITYPFIIGSIPLIADPPERCFSLTTAWLGQGISMLGSRLCMTCWRISANGRISRCIWRR